MGIEITDDMIAHARLVIREIALEHGISEAQVRADMLEAMRDGMDNPDPEVQKQWKKITWRGPEPTPEEFISWMTLNIEREAGTRTTAS